MLIQLTVCVTCRANENIMQGWRYKAFSSHHYILDVTMALVATDFKMQHKRNQNSATIVTDFFLLLLHRSSLDKYRLLFCIIPIIRSESDRASLIQLSQFLNLCCTTGRICISLPLNLLTLRINGHKERFVSLIAPGTKERLCCCHPCSVTLHWSPWSCLLSLSNCSISNWNLQEVAAAPPTGEGTVAAKQHQFAKYIFFY